MNILFAGTVLSQTLTSGGIGWITHGKQGIMKWKAAIMVTIAIMKIVDYYGIF